MSASTNVTSKAAVFVAVAALALTAPLAAADDPLRGLTSSPVEQTGTDSDPCVRHQ